MDDNSTLVKTPRDVWKLPNGTVIVSTADCGWPARYAGRRWRKFGDVVNALDPDSYTGERSTVHIAFFKDPLPAKVVSDVQGTQNTPGAKQ